MLTFNKEKFLVVSIVLVMGLLTYSINNIPCATTGVLNPIIIIVDSAYKFITLEKTPDEISRISENVVISSIERAVPLRNNKKPTFNKFSKNESLLIKHVYQ